MLSEIINIINDSLKPYYKTAVTYGITEMIPTVEEDVVRVYPSVVNEFVECTQMALDNTVSLQVYHRLISKSSQLKSGQYGESNREIIDVYSLSLYAIGNRRMLRENIADVSMRITSLVPDTFKENGKQVAFTVMNGVDFNSAAIINAEFPNTDYSGMPDLFMIRHDYNIRHTYRKKCVECVNECKNYSTLN